MWTQPLCHSQWWQSVTEQHSFKVHSQWVHTVHILCISTQKNILVQQASEKEPNVKGWCRVPYTVHPDSDQFIKFGGHTGAFWHPSALSCKKVFVGIYLFIFSRFQICIFFPACNVNSQEYKLKQLYHVLSLDINTRKNDFSFKLFETINFLCFIVEVLLIFIHYK